MENNIQPTKQSGRSWMLGVIGVYSTFALGTLAVVGFTFTQKVDLVSKQHYEDGVHFQSKIDNSYRAAALKESLSWKLIDGGKVLEISYPDAFRNSSNVSGKIVFFRPSSTSMDKAFSVDVNGTGKQLISLADIPSGFWMVSLDINAGGQGYYKESEVHLH